MTPREASMLEGQILDPSEFPWTDDEAQVVALGVKAQLHSAVADMAANEIDASVTAITRIALAEEVRRREEEKQEESTEVESSLIRIIDNMPTQEE